MKQEYNTEELLAQIAALNNLFDEVRLIDPQTASVLDPDTLQPVGQADNLPILGEDGLVDAGKLKPLAYDRARKDYRLLGDVVGKAYSDGKKLI